MAEWYLGLRHAHIGFAFFSVALFTLRGVLMLAGSRHVQAAWLRYPSYTVDVMLLTVALMLTTVIHQYPFQASWLTTKVVLLVVYIVLGSVALKRGRTPRARAVAFVGALATVAFLFTVARAHHPLGVLAPLLAG
jgi:uncharacterized membrane protein SirB2